MVAVVAALAAAAGKATAAPSASERADGTTLRIWADEDRKAAVERVVAGWASARGLEVEVVVTDSGQIRERLKTVTADEAPDIVLGEHEWTGELAAAGLVLPIAPREAIRRRFPDSALDAFSHGSAVRRLYGAPVTLENVGLVVNTQLARVPRSFADFRSQALAFKRKREGNVAVAVPQGPAGDAYHMYPFFSGLGGYVFGRKKAGNLDPSDSGLAAPRFLANSSTIDAWNKSGLIDSRLDYGAAREAFLETRAVFWITGPSEADALRRSGLRYRIVQLPAITYRSVPFLRVEGLMVTKFAVEHGVESLARELVANHITGVAAQRTLAGANGRFPANATAGSRITDAVLKQLRVAGIGGVPVPNIPQMSSVWPELGGAWAKSTKGTGAVKAREAFLRASTNVANGIR